MHMGLATRIIPSILCRGRQMVKGVKFNSWRTVGLAAQAVRIHNTRGVDELLLLDIAATQEGRGPDLDLIRELSDVCFMPLAVGGGIKSLDDAKAVLLAGADKVVIGSAAWTTDVVRQTADSFGNQAVVAICDVVTKNVNAKTMMYETRTDTEMAPLRARWIAEQGAGEILLQSVDRDGTLEGYDIDTIAAVSKAVSVPVIASGGCGTYEHMRQAIEAGASAVAAGAMFQFTDQAPQGAALYLHNFGIETRIA